MAADTSKGKTGKPKRNSAGIKTALRKAVRAGKKSAEKQGGVKKGPIKVKPEKTIKTVTGKPGAKENKAGKKAALPKTAAAPKKAPAKKTVMARKTVTPKKPSGKGAETLPKTMIKGRAGKIEPKAKEKALRKPARIAAVEKKVPGKTAAYPSVSEANSGAPGSKKPRTAKKKVAAEPAGRAVSKKPGAKAKVRPLTAKVKAEVPAEKPAMTFPPGEPAKTRRHAAKKISVAGKEAEVSAPGKKAASRAPASKGKAAAKVMKEEIPEMTVPLPEERRTKKLKIFLPAEEPEEVSASEVGALPEEYGETEIDIIPLDPNSVFACWEVTKEDLPSEKTALDLRLYDVTGIEFDGINALSIIDIPIGRRAGRGFFSISMPGREVIAEMGVVGPGKRFKPLARSRKVSLPRILKSDELGIAEGLFEMNMPVGY